MTTSHKVVLSLIATICITLIVFYSVKGNQQNAPRLTITPPVAVAAPASDADDRPMRDGAIKRAPMETPIVVGRSENNRATGLDDLVAKVRSEVTANDAAVADAAPHAANRNEIPPLAAITDTASSNAIASSPGTTPDHTTSDASALDATLSLTPGDAATDASATPNAPLDSATAPLDVQAPSITSTSTDSDTPGVPTFTLGEPLEKPLTSEDSNTDPTRPTSPTDDHATDDYKSGAGEVKDSEFADLAIVEDTGTPLVKVSGDTNDATASDATSASQDQPSFSGTDIPPFVIDPHKPAVASSESETTFDAQANTRADAKRDETRAATNAQAIAPSTQDTPKPEPVTAAPAMRTYTIKAGDSFSSIATAIYGAERHWIDIADANPTIDPKRVRIGQTINLPIIDKDDDKPATAATGNPKTDAAAVATPKVEPSQLEKLRADAAVVAAAAAAAQVKIHEVAAGENLSSISRKHFNTPDHWRHVYLTNRQTIGSDPSKLHVGMKLKITPPVKE